MMETTRAKLADISDENLFNIKDELPDFAGMEGYSSEAKLQLAVFKSSLHAELIQRGLIPSIL